jgi:hypothetical protein
MGSEAFIKVLSLRRKIVNSRLRFFLMRRFPPAGASRPRSSPGDPRVCKQFTSTAPTWRISRSEKAGHWSACTARSAISAPGFRLIGPLSKKHRKGLLPLVLHALAAHVPDARKAIIPGTSHWMFEQAPQRFCAIVLEFLAA